MTDAIVQVTKYLTASGLVGIVGVLLNTRMSNHHELKKESIQANRDRYQDWVLFQRESIVELQDIMWQVIELIGTVETEVELVHLNYSTLSDVRDHLHKLTGLLRRVEILSARIEDDNLRRICERLRIHAFAAMPADKKEPGWNRKEIEAFTKEYNDNYRDQVRVVLAEIIANKVSDSATKSEPEDTPSS